MPTSNLGSRVAIAVIVVFIAWTTVRGLAARPPAVPNIPFPIPAVDAPKSSAPSTATAILAGGCFWGVQAVFQHLQGVISATSGYTGGFVKSPGYETVSSGASGHAESVRVVYDPSKISYGQILMIYFSVAHDPTQWNRQGPDTGSQYRSAVFYSTPEQKQIAESYIAQLNAAKAYSRPIVTKVQPFDAFYPAEEYHQDYLKNHPRDPYIVFNDLPKLGRLKAEFPSLYKDF